MKKRCTSGMMPSHTLSIAGGIVTSQAGLLT